MSRGAVLVADDDTDFRELVRLVAQSMGIQVFEAGTCQEAIAVLTRERSRIRLVLLDYFMPGMEPAACARALLEVALPDTSVVLCTASVHPAGRAAELGLAGSLSKPFSIADLECVLREARGVSPP
jgi:CheY-like chemotaxis protein